MDPDGWLPRLLSIRNHSRFSMMLLLSLKICPIVRHRDGELVVIVLCEQVCLLLVEELKTLLCVAEKHILSVDDHLAASFGVLDASVNRELAILRIGEIHEHLFYLSSVNDGLQAESYGREAIVVQVQFEVGVEALIVERVVYFLLTALELMITQEDKLVLARRKSLRILALHELCAIVSSGLLFVFQGVVKPQVKRDGQAVLDRQGWDQQVVVDTFVASRLFSEHTIGLVVLPHDILVAMQPVLDSWDLELLRPLLATIRLDTNLQLVHDVLVAIVRHGDRLSRLHSCLVQHKSLLLGLAIHDLLLNEELLDLVRRLSLVDQHVLRANGQNTA